MIWALRGQQPEVEAQGHQPLPCLVVQFTADSFALFFLRLNEMSG
jgi:hypothetical protein